MPKHSLKPGIAVIRAISSLGEALGYGVLPEFPVEERANAPAVDVGWFSGDEQRYPLMIFEVESAATNAMANNPTKVYGQPQEKFERPLFFFHIVLNTGTETTRIDNLRRLFGQHNYRVYELDRGMREELVIDILSQHRRLQSTFDLGDFLAALKEHSYFDVAPEFLVNQAIRIGLRARYRNDLAALAVTDSRYREAFLCSIETNEHAQPKKRLDLGYRSYFGCSWSTPIHLALLVHAKRLAAHEGLERLKWWQERSSYLSQIGPHFGLSRDYDLFILGMAAGLWTLLAGLMVSHPPTLDYIASQMLTPLDKLAKAANEASFYTGVWALHVSAFCPSDEHYEAARSFLNERGGVPEACLYNRPAMLNLDDESDWLTQTESPSILVPPKPEFREQLSRRVRESRSVVTPFSVACQLLAADDGTYEGPMPTLGRHLSAFLANSAELPV